MCLILFAYHWHPDYPLVVAANRDEFHERPTESAHRWPEAPHVLAGRDGAGRGTWLGVTEAGRFAALTNFREPQESGETRSRGELTRDFLLDNGDAPRYLDAVHQRAGDYAGFNLLVGGPNGLYYYSNRIGRREPLTPGLYGLSNGFLDAPWPKVRAGRERLEAALHPTPGASALLSLLTDETPAADEALPDTGIGLAMERFLSPMFIRSSRYGTRASTALLIDRSGGIDFAEQTYGSDGAALERRDFRVTAQASIPP